MSVIPYVLWTSTNEVEISFKCKPLAALKGNSGTVILFREAEVGTTSILQTAMCIWGFMS